MLRHYGNQCGGSEDGTKSFSTLSFIIPGEILKVWCLYHLEPQLGKGLGIKEHTEIWVTLEARMPVILCSKTAYIALFLTSGQALGLEIFHFMLTSYQMTKSLPSFQELIRVKTFRAQNS